MNNAQMDHFVRNPIGIEKNRSKFDLSHDKLTTIMPGRLCPILLEEVLPGDTVTLDLSSLVRMSTPLHPVMDNAFMDVHFFFVPNRIVWDNWKLFMGESDNAPWVPTSVPTVPYVQSPVSIGWQKGSVADYFDLPIGKAGIRVSCLPFRAYISIWNNFYRDQNLMSVAECPKDNSNVVGDNTNISNYDTLWVGGSRYVLHAKGGVMTLPVCRMHDMFSSALPYPQRGPSVSLNLAGYAPVSNATGMTGVLFNPVWYKQDGTPWNLVHGILNTDNTDGSTNVNTPSYTAYDSDFTTGGKAFLHLQADMTNISAVTITQLRNAIMVQRYYEALARGGARYFEQIKAFFGVTVPDATVQIPEFLGGRRIPINMTQVAQTSESSSTNKLGSLAAYSLTTDKDSIFTKSFTEHGYLIGVCCVRAEHSYSQGVPRHFSRFVTQDYYNPLFAFTSEQPVYNRELYYSGNATTDAGVFGYRAAWDEYRCHQNQVNGEFRPDYSQSLDSYHYGDDYPSTPALSTGWIAEPSSYIQRTLAVTSHDFFLCNFHFDMKAVRPLPLYSVPGLARF